MKFIFIAAILILCGCSHTDTQTLTNLNYTDMQSPQYTTQHPLVCGDGRDFPDGCELIFNNPDSEKMIHAVFPEKQTAPSEMEHRFILTGYYQGIQNHEKYTLKKPDSGYEYFVVTSWEYEK